MSQPTRLLCTWDSPGKTTGVSCHALLQGIFPNQGLNPCLLCLLLWHVVSSPIVPPGLLLHSTIILNGRKTHKKDARKTHKKDVRYRKEKTTRMYLQ